MTSTKRSSTKSGGSKRAASKRCAPTKSKSISTPTSDLAPPPVPAIIIPPDVVNTVACWALDGNSGFNIAEAATEKFPNWPAADVLRAVGEHFRAAGAAEAAPIRGFCIEAYREIYRKALGIGDLATALKALARLERAAAG